MEVVLVALITAVTTLTAAWLGNRASAGREERARKAARAEASEARRFERAERFVESVVAAVQDPTSEPDNVRGWHFSERRNTPICGWDVEIIHTDLVAEPPEEQVDMVVQQLMPIGGRGDDHHSSDAVGQPSGALLPRTQS